MGTQVAPLGPDPRNRSRLSCKTAILPTYNACLAELQEVAAPIAARLRADYEAGSPASVKPGALIADLEAIASMKALNATLIGLTEDLPPPAHD